MRNISQTHDGLPLLSNDREAASEPRLVDLEAAAHSVLPVAPRGLPISFRGIALAALCGDVLLVGLARVVSRIFLMIYSPVPNLDITRDVGAAIFVAVLFVMSQKLRELYAPMELLNLQLQLRAVVGAWIGAFMILASGLFTWRLGDGVSRWDLIAFGVTGGFALVAHRFAWAMILPAAMRTGGLRPRKSALLVCEHVKGASVAQSLQSCGNNVAISTTLTGLPGSAAFQGQLEKLIASVRGESIEEVFVAASIADLPGLKIISHHLRMLPQPVTLVPVEDLRELVRNPRVDLGSLVGLELKRAPLSIVELTAKRAVDILVSFSALVLLSPVLLLASIAIALDSPGPILFRQTRHGFNGLAFKIYKFRSMRVLENGVVIRQATVNDPRVTRVGRWLRRYSVDELPQLLNVLAGDMSIVGPRPHATAHDQYFSEALERYAFRQHVKAGLTGWAQVQGARGETETVEKMQRRVDLDIWYISNWSIWLDFYIMLKTLTIVFKAENAH